MAKYFYMEWDNQTDEEIQAPSVDELIAFVSSYGIESDPDLVAADAARDRCDDAGTDLADPYLWPREFHLYDFDRKYVGLFSVEMEYSQDFYAYKVTE